MTSGAALLLALALAAGGVDVEAGLTAGVRSRNVLQGEQPWQRTLELVAIPSLLLLAERPDWRASVGYVPRLTAPDVSAGDRVDAWQELFAEALVRASPTLRLEGYAFGALGTSSLLSDTWRTSGPAPVRTSDRIHHYAYRVGAATEARLGRSTTLDADLGWSQGGGSDAASRELLPVEQALRLDATLRWRVTRLDELQAELHASDTRLDLGTGATIVLLSGRWRRQLTEALAAWASGGGGLVIADGAEGAEPPRLALLGELGVEHDLPSLASTQRAMLRALPVVDRLQGTVDPRVEGEYTGTLGQLPGWRVTGRLLAAMTSRAPGTDRLLLAMLGLERGLARELTALLALQGSRQRSTDPALPVLREWVALAGIEWRPPSPPRARGLTVFR